jgi:hypothetical protein
LNKRKYGRWPVEAAILCDATEKNTQGNLLAELAGLFSGTNPLYVSYSFTKSTFRLRRVVISHEQDMPEEIFWGFLIVDELVLRGKK